MAKLPTVAIIGRPNTGKSTLFNRMAGSRIAIESEVAGTTRDHVLYKVEGDEVDYLLTDTGGIGGGTNDKDFEDDVQAQSVLAIAAADVIVLTINSREELTKGDREAVTLLRKRKRKHVPVIVVMTKVDNSKLEDEAISNGLALGLSGDVLAVSAPHGLGVGTLEELIEEKLKNLHFAKGDQKTEGENPRIAIVGKPNVGKSSLVNALMSEEQRQTSPRLVSDIPGTTRDSADTIIRHEGKTFTFVDTAGLKRAARTEKSKKQKKRKRVP
jgi:GTP-binding protein